MADIADRSVADTDRAGKDTTLTRRIGNPRSIRALAHPARVAIIEALGTGEELTATQCAALTGLSPSATAYHLKFLERAGFAETAPPRPDRRERPWRRSRYRTEIDLESSTTAGDSATAAVLAAYIDATRDAAVAFASAAQGEPEEWRSASWLLRSDSWLTVEEAEKVAEKLAAVLNPYRGRSLCGKRPAGSRRVRVMSVVVPHTR